MLLLLLAIFRFLSYSSPGTIEAVVRRCSIKKVFLKILQISQKTLVPETLFNKVAVNFI